MTYSPSSLLCSHWLSRTYPLHYAIASGDDNRVSRFVNVQMALNHSDPLNAPFVIPFEARNYLARFSADHGRDYNALRYMYQFEGMTPLTLAMSQEHTKILRILARSNLIDLNKFCKNFTPLQLSITMKKPLASGLLLNEPNINLDKRANDGSMNTAAHLAAKYGQAETLCALYLKEANLNLFNAEGYTPLHVAIKEGQIDTALALIDTAHVTLSSLTRRRGDIDLNLPSSDSVKSTPAHLSAILGQTEVLKALECNGADMNALDAQCYTPLCHSILNQQEASTLALLQMPSVLLPDEALEKDAPVSLYQDIMDDDNALLLEAFLEKNPGVQSTWVQCSSSDSLSLISLIDYAEKNDAHRCFRLLLSKGHHPSIKEKKDQN